MHAFHHPKAFASVALPPSLPRFSKLLHFLSAGISALAAAVSFLLVACFSHLKRSFCRLVLSGRNAHMFRSSDDGGNADLEDRGENRELEIQKRDRQVDCPDEHRDAEDHDGDRGLEYQGGRKVGSSKERNRRQYSIATALTLRPLAFRDTLKGKEETHADASPFLFSACNDHQDSDKHQIKIGRVTPGISVMADNVLGGTGLALASAPMEQDKVYFEVRVVEPGRMLIGASRAFAARVTRWSDGDYDALLQERSVSKSFVEFGNPNGVPVEKNDIICCAFNQADLPTSLEFFVNGALFAAHTLTGLRGEVWPAVVLRDGAEAQLIFDPVHCRHSAAFEVRGFKTLMLSRSLIG